MHTSLDHSRRRLRAAMGGWAALALLVAAGGCDDASPFDPGRSDPAIGVALSAPALTVTQGESGTVTVNLSRSGGYSGAVELTVEGAPAGVTATFAPGSVPGSTASSTLTIASAASEQFGTFQLTVRAQGQGVATRTATLALTVNRPSQAQPFTVTVEPAEASLPRGQSGSVLARVTRHGGFTGPVSLVVTGTASGLGIGVPTITGDTASIQLATTTATGTVPEGIYQVTLRAFSGGSAFEQTLALNVRVTAPLGGTNVTWRFCRDGYPPLWVAYQSEDGAWTHSPTIGRTHSFTIGARGGVAWVVPSDTEGGYETHVVYGTAAELVQFGSQGCAFGASDGKRLTGSVTGVQLAGFAQVQLGGAWVRTQPFSTSFVLADVADGPQDLIASRIAMTGGASNPSTTLDRFIIRRGLNLPNNGAIPTLDFESSEAFQPVMSMVTLAGLGSEQATVTLAYQTANGGSSPFGGMFGGYFMGLPSSAATLGLPFVPGARQREGDLHVMTVSAIGGSSSSNSSMRSQTSFFHAAGDRTATLGPALSTPTVSIAASAPVVRPRTQLARQAEYGSMLWLSFQQPNRELSVTATAGYFGGAPAGWDVTVPDLAGVDLFNPQWGLRPGTATEWSASAFGYSGGLSQMLTPTSGSSWQFAQRGGRLTP